MSLGVTICHMSLICHISLHVTVTMCHPAICHPAIRHLTCHSTRHMSLHFTSHHSHITIYF